MDSTIDLTVFIGYLMIMMGFGIWISRTKDGETESTQDYFLASRALPWWAVGSSLLASNISTEQILGMNGSGYAIGLAIASYELMAAVTLLVVAKFFLPVFLKKGIYTMPQFLEERYDSRVKTIMAFFWVILFVLVNISSIFYLGGLAIENIMDVPLYIGIIGLVVYSAAFSIFGGLKAVVWTDVAQVVVLVIGGFVASWLVVTAVGDGSYIAGLSELFAKAPEKFDMIFTKDVTYTDLESGETRSAYELLPGIGVLIGGMWIANLYYWGNNQYIIQRALAAKNISEAQRGVAFAAFLKLLMPLIVVVPGIACFVILQDPTAYGFTGEGIVKEDQAFPWVLNNFVGVGFKGLVFAALVAAIGSSVSSMVNSTSTIFTLDIYRPLMAKNKSDMHLVRTGKIVAGVTLVLGALIAPSLGSLGQILQYIQEYTGFVSPGVVAVFIWGLFWKRGTANAAFAAIIICFLALVAIKIFYPVMPFLDRMAFGFLLASAVIVAISLLENSNKVASNKNDMVFRIGLAIALVVVAVPSGVLHIVEGTSIAWAIVILGMSLGVIVAVFMDTNPDNTNAVKVETAWFKTDTIFNFSSLVVCAVLAIIYLLLW